MVFCTAPFNELRINTFAHGFVSGVAGVKVVSGVTKRIEASGVLGSPGDPVEVDDPVEYATRTDRVVDVLADLLALVGVVTGVPIGS